MCDLNRVSGFLIAAKVAYLASLITLGVAMINSASLFAAAANVPLMVAVIVLAGVTTGMYVVALVELDKCATDACARELQRLRSDLLLLLANMAAYTISLVGIAVVAAIPFAGAAAIGAMIALFIGLTVGVSVAIEATFAWAVQEYNKCRERVGASTLIVVVLVLAYIIVVVALVFSLGGGLSGKYVSPVSIAW